MKVARGLTGLLQALVVGFVRSKYHAQLKDAGAPNPMACRAERRKRFRLRAIAAGAFGPNQRARVLSWKSSAILGGGTLATAG